MGSKQTNPQVTEVEETMGGAFSKQTNTQLTEKELTQWTETLTRELKENYKRFNDSVRPILFSKVDSFSMDDVFVESEMKYQHRGSWFKLGSYQDILKDYRDLTITIIKGRAGYGKSTLALRFVHDWCNEKSISKEVKILIFLRFRQLEGLDGLGELDGLQFITKAIKKFILSKSTLLNDKVIEEILKSNPSVLLVLDGLNEYFNMPGSPTGADILTKKIMGSFKAIVTTRHLPRLLQRNSRRIMLAEFKDEARDNYMTKVVKDDSDAMKRIKDDMSRNDVLHCLCDVPLFFAMYVHMSYGEKLKEESKVTEFFKHAIKHFHRHMELKTGDPNSPSYTTYQENHSALDRIAFQSFSTKEKAQKIMWTKEMMNEKLGKEFVDQYLRTGILVEEEEIDDDCVTDLSNERETHIKFYHNVFREWYAAGHLAKLAERLNFYALSNILGDLNLSDIEYLFRFACGLSPKDANKILRFVKGLRYGDRHATLCILETDGPKGDILDTVQDLCSGDIKFDKDQSKFEQLSIIHLIAVAAKNTIQINRVILHGSRDTTSTDELSLTSGLQLPALQTLNCLRISEQGRTLYQKDLASIWKYCEQCKSIDSLEFNGCMLPQKVWRSEVGRIPVKVFWQPRDSLGYQYRLHIESGRWTHNYEDTFVSDKEYGSSKKQFN